MELLLLILLLLLLGGVGFAVEFLRVFVLIAIVLLLVGMVAGRRNW